MSQKKFQNKYRIASNRLKNWDYGRNSAYFITICTHDRKHYFGEIKNGEMHLNQLGENATRFWLEIPNHFPFIELGNFVVMPNHNRKINPDFKWQSNYHDHIIRNSLAFENIQNYIEKNPSKWKEDTFCTNK